MNTVSMDVYYLPTYGGDHSLYAGEDILKPQTFSDLLTPINDYSCRLYIEMGRHDDVTIYHGQQVDESELIDEVYEDADILIDLERLKTKMNFVAGVFCGTLTPLTFGLSLLPAAYFFKNAYFQFRAADQIGTGMSNAEYSTSDPISEIEEAMHHSNWQEAYKKAKDIAKINKLDTVYEFYKGELEKGM